MATKTKHTPGPWCVTHYSGGDKGIYRESDGRDVALVRGYDERTCANAALIAHAPEMLAELRQAELALRHAAQESAGRVRREIVDGWILRAGSIRDLIYNATDEAIDASGMPI